jgi:ipoprotein LpqH
VGGRFLTAAVTVLMVVASCSGCSSSDNHDGRATQKTARITVDNNTRTSHAIVCSQVQWWLTADIAAAPARVQVLLNLDSDKPKLESVNINNFAGFTGVADAGAGHAKVVFARDTYTITGEAEGSQLNDPRVSLTAPFKIEVGC